MTVWIGTCNAGLGGEQPSTRRTMADDDREDNGWILVGRKENSRDILTYERPEYIVQREQPTCDKKW